MHVLGVTKQGDFFQWALARFDQEIIFDRMETTSTIPEEIVSIKDLIIVTGLQGSSVLRRDLKLPITNPKTILEAVPFQLESLLPYPMDQTVVYPELHPSDKETFIVAWATTHQLVENHITKWKTDQIEPDFVSSETLALARWARFSFPKERELVAFHNTIGIALNHDKIVCAMESSDPGRLKHFLKQKYPLYTWVDQRLTEETWNFAIPIGLALEPFQKQPCQFRPKKVASSRQKKREGLLIKAALALGMGLTLTTAVVSTTIFYFRESKLKDQIALYQPTSAGSLETRVQNFRESLIKASKTKPSVFNFPSTQTILAWLSTLQTPIEITHFSYELQTPAQVQISLEFQAGAPGEADRFIKLLQQKPTFVESTQDLKWTSSPQGYKLSFNLRKNS